MWHQNAVHVSGLDPVLEEEDNPKGLLFTRVKKLENRHYMKILYNFLKLVTMVKGMSLFLGSIHWGI